MEQWESQMSSGDQSSDLPILSKELKVDTKLKFSNKKEEFKRIITDSVKPLTTLEEKIEKMNEIMQKRISLPNNYVFATISEGLYADDEKLYKDEDGRDLHGQIVYTGIGNWKLLRVAHDPCSTERTSASVNGYCGAAYWNPDTQQVIIAHCGTKNKEGVYNDIYGVFRNEHVSQIDSAVTFTDEIIRVLSEINGEKGSNIQLFFTGHSLGAWLATITAFSAKFLHRNDDCFVSNPDFEDSGYHSSTVIFDGPGSKRMLERIRNRLMRRYGNGRTISSLDIKNYLSAPHLINACNLQVGDVYRLFIPLTEEDKAHLESLRNKTFFQKILDSVKELSVETHAVVYTHIMHKMKNIKRVFCNKTGDVLDDNGNLRIQKVTDWPLLISGSEKEAFKIKLIQGGMDKLGFFQKLYTQVFGMVNATSVLECLLFGSMCGGIQIISGLYNLPKWYKDLTHELDNFLKVADGTNNYDPVQASSSGAVGSHIRYKTEYVDENYSNTHTLNVFKNCELKFLEQYKTLEEYDKHLHVIVNLKEVFSVFEKDEKLLSSVMDALEACKIENGIIYSVNVREHISYIKNMLHLFPEIQRNVTKAFKGLPSEASGKYYNKLSESYLKSFRNFLKLKEDSLGLKSFLVDVDRKILHLVNSCTTFETERTYETFKIICKDFPTYEKKHIFFNLSRIFDLGYDVFISYLKKLHIDYMLCIECDDILNSTVKSFLCSLFEMLQESDICKGYKLKIILITKKESDVSSFVIENFLNCKSIYRKEESEVSFDDLNTEFRKKLLDRTVLLQGKKVSFSNVVKGCSNLCNIISSETIVDLYQNKLIKIGKKISGFGIAENHYIDRQVVQKVKVETEILWDEELTASNTLLAVSNSCKKDISRLIANGSRHMKLLKGPENDCTDRIAILDESNDFESLYRKHKDCNIHWLEMKGNDLIWKKSYAKSFDVLRKHIENKKHALKEDEYSIENNSFKLVNFDDVNSFEEKLVVIAAEPGMGKTTGFTHLVKTWLDSNINHSQFLARINLIEYKKELNEEKQFKSALDIINLFFSNDSELTKKLMESRLLESGDIVFLLDGFDEISSSGQENIVGLLKILLRDTKVDRVFISTRFHLRNELEDNFSTLAYSFKPLFRKDQEEFLQKFWKEDFPPGTEEACVQNIVKSVLDYISESIGDNEREFMGIPLQMRMVAEVFRKSIKDKTFTDDPECCFPENFNILQLYNRFVYAKYREYFKKIGAENIDLDDDIEEDWFAKALTKKHRIVAFKTLFPEYASDFNCEIPLSKKDELKINSIGIAQIINNEPVFIHRTFAEYYVAKFLARRLHQKQNNVMYETTLKFLKKEIFERKNEVIRRFLTYHLAKDELFSAFLAKKWDAVGSIISDPQRRQVVDALGRNVWHYVAECLVGDVEVDFNILRHLMIFPDLDLGKTDYLEMSPLDYMNDYTSVIRKSTQNSWHTFLIRDHPCNEFKEYSELFRDENFAVEVLFNHALMLANIPSMQVRKLKYFYCVEHEIAEIDEAVDMCRDGLVFFMEEFSVLLNGFYTFRKEYLNLFPRLRTDEEEKFSVSLEVLCSFRKKFSELMNILSVSQEAYYKVIKILTRIKIDCRKKNHASIAVESSIVKSINLYWLGGNESRYLKKAFVWHIFVFFKRLHRII